MIETEISKGIIQTYFNKLEKNLQLDVAIVGGVLPALSPLTILPRQDCVWLSLTVNSHRAVACGAVL